jgi:hypothetical protein
MGQVGMQRIVLVRHGQWTLEGSWKLTDPILFLEQGYFLTYRSMMESSPIKSR